MTQELFYTSAPRGLQPGSTGFCTVAETRGLSPLLRERLEDLSGYRELFPPHDARASQNPVAWSHCRLTIQGKTVSVLSRVGAAGVDHSQRTNKFAHHVVVENQEQNAAGPAALLARPGFMDIVWDGKVRTLPSGRPVPAFDVRPAPCVAWQRITGDAGWAGALVEAFLTNRPVYLLYPLGLDPLPLLVEALALLPMDKRWQVTFSTYFTVLPSGSSCAWRCVPLESAGAAEALRAPGALVVRLDSSQGAAPAGSAMEAARAGHMVTVGPSGAHMGGAVEGSRVQAPHREATVRYAPSASQGPRQEVTEPSAAPHDANISLATVQLMPVRPQSSILRGFPAGVAVGIVGAMLLGVGIWLGVGLRPMEGSPPAGTGENREAEVERRIAAARKQWEEKDLPQAIERGRTERGEELRKEVLIARNCRVALPIVLGDLDAATLEDEAALKKTFTARLDALKAAPEDRKVARNSRDLLPQIFPMFDISTLADSGKFKAELERARKATRDNAIKDKGVEQNAMLAKVLPLLHFYFGLDEKDIAEKTPMQLEGDTQGRYVQLLEKEANVDVELDKITKLNNSYRSFLAKRMENWRKAVVDKERSDKEMHKEAEDIRVRLALERPARTDPLFTKDFVFPMTWVVDYFDALDRCEWVLKYSRREVKRNRAMTVKNELVALRAAAIEELDRYLKTPPK